MNIDQIENGIVLDHIRAGLCMHLYRHLNLSELDCSVAIIKNARSNKMGRKDVIKISDVIDLDLDILGYIDPNITVNIIKNGRIADKRRLELPQRVENILTCKNPRCITTAEPELKQVFLLTDAAKREYRCLYCEEAGKQG